MYKPSNSLRKAPSHLSQLVLPAENKFHFNVFVQYELWSCLLEKFKIRIKSWRNPNGKTDVSAFIERVDCSGAESAR